MADVVRLIHLSDDALDIIAARHEARTGMPFTDELREQMRHFRASDLVAEFIDNESLPGETPEQTILRYFEEEGY